MSYQEHEHLWLAHGKKNSGEKKFLDPYALYGFFSNATSERPYNRRAKSALARAASQYDPARHRNCGHPPGYKTPEFQIGNPRNPAPTPTASRPDSSRSGYSSAKPVKMNLSSPSAYYLGFQRTRCKSAPSKSPRYVPRRPQTSRSMKRSGSVSTSIRRAPQRAWELRTNSASNHRSLLSPKEVQQRQKERCKSAPLPYDFSRVELVTEVPENSTDCDRLRAMTKPLACMPNIVKNAVNHNGLRHCCSAYNTRTNITPETRHQFWPVPRPSVYRRGFVPEYFSFVKPAHLSGGKPPTITCSSPTDDDLKDKSDEDLEEEIIFEESFIYPETPSELSMSDKYDPSDDDIDVVDDIVNEYLQSGIVSDPEDYDDSLSLLPEPNTMSNQDEVAGSTTEDDQVPEIEVIITKSESVSPEKEPEIVEEKEEKAEEENSDKVTTELTEDQLPEAATDKGAKGSGVSEVTTDFEDSILHEPEIIPEEEPPEQGEPKICSPPIPIPETPRVTFIDSIKVTSYKSPEPKDQRTEQIKPILKTPKSSTPIMEEKPTEVLAKKPKPRPLVERREADLRPQIKPGIILKPEPPKIEEKKKEVEEVEEPKPLEEKLPEPEFVHAPGAYRMYQPIDLVRHELEQAKKKTLKKTTTSAMPLPYVGLSGQHQMLPESNSVKHSIMEDERRKKEGMKPWLQGRLALSKQTSRFELPMDVKVLESMTAMEYLTKYCIISTRRKALYKQVFQKVDKDRDGIISYRELDKGLHEIHVDSIDVKQVRNIVEMIGADDRTKFNMKQFSAISAFSERILFSNFVTEETKTINNTKEIIEEADFCSLKSKLDGFNVNPKVRRILESL